MTDIFLSYNEKDREAARRLASTLEAVGWSVWWDRRIPAGETWRSVLEMRWKDALHGRPVVVAFDRKRVGPRKPPKVAGWAS
ncbi:MAG: toll/interleukin-1 receptor domain-containing protein [Dechloromonas sp.]|nr:MAG: toll/interleukin-1 receptor domain-containing protein [Dechloromonas sp.]